MKMPPVREYSSSLLCPWHVYALPCLKDQGICLYDVAIADEAANKTADKLMTNPMFKKFLQDIMSLLTKQIVSLETKVEKLEETVFDLQKDNEKMTREQEGKDAQIAVLQESLSMDRDVIIDFQQAQNRNMLMISWVPEKKREIDSESASAVFPEDTESVVIKLVKEKIGIDIKEDDIDRS